MKEPQERYYIAYGSNLHKEQMSRRCPDARVVGTGWLRDWRLLFCGEPEGPAYLTIQPEEGCWTPVAVWAVSPQDEEALDWYEGYPTLYDKTDLELEVREAATGERKDYPVFVYIMTEELGPGLPTKEYLQTCAQGYEDFGFPTAILREALDESRRRRSMPR